jgi:hypothetical protein
MYSNMCSNIKDYISLVNVFSKKSYSFWLEMRKESPPIAKLSIEHVTAFALESNNVIS